jgi:hypothetical protein
MPHQRIHGRLRTLAVAETHEKPFFTNLLETFLSGC